MTILQHSIIGLPRSGKTTFLAVLWHLITANEVSSKFALNQLIGEHTHLNTIADAWLKCEEVPRTSMAAETKVSMRVKEVATGKEAILHFPDLSGESFELQLSSRSCTPDYIEGLEGNGGVLLFVTADRASDGMAILDIPPLVEGESVAEKPEEHKEWKPEMVPTQVNLVELLQFLQRHPFKRTTRRIAIIVSAWDVIAIPDLNPVQWLERELPLLHQFLITNSSSFNFRVYGVSAQGGDVKTDRRNELAMKMPSTRISCVGYETDPHDLTSPLAWLMSSE